MPGTMVLITVVHVSYLGIATNASLVCRSCPFFFLSIFCSICVKPPPFPPSLLPSLTAGSFENYHCRVPRVRKFPKNAGSRSPLRWYLALCFFFCSRKTGCCCLLFFVFQIVLLVFTRVGLRYVMSTASSLIRIKMFRRST